METIVVKKGIINVAAAAGANVKVDAASGAFRGQTIICEDNTISPPVEILPPIPTGACIYGIKQDSQAEVRQVAMVGRTAETVVAATRYRIEIWNGQKLENETRESFKYAYTSDAVLSGNAATDRVNVYTALANKINAHAANGVIAYVVSSVAYTTGSTAVPIVGEIVTQLTSGATAIITAVVQTSGTITGTDAAGTVYLSLLTGTWSSASKTITGATSGAVMTTAAALTAGAGLAIVDDAGYYAARPKGGRGISAVSLTQGFTAAEVEVAASTIAVGAATGLAVGLPGQYSFGIGTRMLQNVPVFTPDGVQIVTGEADWQLNAAPLAGTTYRAYWMQIDEKVAGGVLTGYSMNSPYWVVLWVNEDSGDTNVDAFETALEAGLGITFV